MEELIADAVDPLIVGQIKHLKEVRKAEVFTVALLGTPLAHGLVAEGLLCLSLNRDRRDITRLATGEDEKIRL